MYRCTDRGLIDNDENLTVDPDFIEDALKRLTVYKKGYFDAVWQHTTEQDPFELSKIRRKQKTYLARYMRVSPGYWDDVEVVELDNYVSEVSELLKLENKPSED